MKITLIKTTESKNGVRNVISNRRVCTGYEKTPNGDFVPYEGTLERDFLVLASFGARTKKVTAQPLRIQYKDGNAEIRHYTPDFLVEFNKVGKQHAWTPCLYEIKYREELEERWEELRPKFQAASQLCKERNWRFRIATDDFIRTDYLKNVYFLRRYIEWSDSENLSAVLLETMDALKISTPSELLAAAFWNKDRRMAAVGVFWHLIYAQRIGADITNPLTMETQIWAIEEDKND